LNLTIAHQYIEQMSDEVRAAVFGNVGTMIVFRVGAYDAEVLEKEFAPKFTSEDIVNLGIFQIYLKLMIDGVASQPFSATTMPPIAPQATSFRDKILEYSRATFAHPRALAEKDVIDQSGGQGEQVVPATVFPRVQNSPARPPAQTVPRAHMPPPPQKTEYHPQAPRPPVQNNYQHPQSFPQRPPLAPSEGFSSFKDMAKVLPPKKAGTEEHKQNLRAALSDVLKKQPVPAGGKTDSGERVVGALRTSEPESVLPKANNPQNNHKEVPEDVLRGILDSK